MDEKREALLIAKIMAEPLISFRPSFWQLAGSIKSALFLHKTLNDWRKNKNKPFYRFNLPCEHELYKPGESWSEILCMSRREIDAAHKKTAQRLTKQNWLKHDFKHDKPIEFWVNSDRTTFYRINSDNLYDSIEHILLGDKKELSNE